MSGPDLTDPRDNPLIPTHEPEPLPAEQDPALNPMIPMISDPPWGPTTAPLPGPGPTVDQLEGMLAKFLKDSNAADYERLKALFRI